jgi:hypothetical protein
MHLRSSSESLFTPTPPPYCSCIGEHGLTSQVSLFQGNGTPDKQRSVKGMLHMRKRTRGAIAALLLTGVMTVGSAGTASAAGFGEGSPGKWQSGEVGYRGGCALANWLFHTHCS